MDSVAAPVPRPAALPAVSYLEALLAPGGEADAHSMPSGSGEHSLQAQRPVEGPGGRLQSVVVVPERSQSGAADTREGVDGGGWTMVGRGRRPPFYQRAPPHPKPHFSHLKEMLFTKAREKCFRCLEPGHRVESCTNRAKCLLCGTMGHRARWCGGQQPAGAVRGKERAEPVVVLPPPPPGPPPSSAVRAPMEASAADVYRRHGLVIATARRTVGQAEAERRLTRCAVVAVVVGLAKQFELVDVKRAIAMRFRMHEEAVKASLRVLGEMMLIFNDAAIRDKVLTVRGPLVLGWMTLLVTPWSRFRRATPTKMLYKVRVCLEGVPEHAWDVESVASLFDPSMLIDEIGHEVRQEQETGCFRLWGWMDAVEKLKTRGVLQLEEPREDSSPGMHFPELNIMQEMPPRWGQVAMLGHPVLIHLDHVVDFTCPPTSSPDSGMSCDSGISGLSSGDGMLEPWPARWGYRWYLNYEEGDFPPPPLGLCSLATALP